MDVEMNQRIRELAEEAGFRYIKDEGIGWAGNHNSSLPRFAELIVKECVGIVEGRGFLHDQAPDAIFARECSSAIKRHFEVK
jgi:hypothetical protein